MTSRMCLKDAINIIIENEKSLIDFSKKYSAIYRDDERAVQLFEEVADVENGHTRFLSDVLKGLTEDQCTFMIDQDHKSLRVVDPETVGGYDNPGELSLREVVQTLEIMENRAVDGLKSIRRVFAKGLNLHNVINEDSALLDKIFAYSQTGEAFADQYIASGMAE